MSKKTLGRYISDVAEKTKSEVRKESAKKAEAKRKTK